MTYTSDPFGGPALISSAVPRRGTKVGYGPAVFNKTSHSSTPTMTSTTKWMLPTGPNTADTPEASLIAC